MIRESFQFPESSVIKKTTASGGSAWIVGTSHLSDSSPALVRGVIRNTRPNTVVLELCNKRYTSLFPSAEMPSIAYPQSTSFPGLFSILFAYLMSSSNRALSEIFEKSKYGDDIRMGKAGADEAGANIIAGDRCVFLTLARAGPELKWKDFRNSLPIVLGGIQLPPHYDVPAVLLWRLCMAVFRLNWDLVALRLEEILDDAEQQNVAFSHSPVGRSIDMFNRAIIQILRTGQVTIPQKEYLGDAFKKILLLISTDQQFLESVPKAFTIERDLLLANTIKQAPGETVVAVVGEGHLPGINKHWDTVTPETVEQYLQRPPHLLRSTLYTVGSVFAITTGSILLWKRARPAFYASAGLAAAGVCFGTMLYHRINDTSHRLHAAFSKPIQN